MQGKYDFTSWHYSRRHLLKMIYYTSLALFILVALSRMAGLI
jgi:hypothetical protein